MAKRKKQQGFIKNLQREIISDKTYEIQNGKSINDLRTSVAQFPYSLVINLIPIKRTINKEALSFGVLARKRDKQNSIENFNNGIVGINASQNERIMLNVLATLISNSNFQLDIKSKDVDLSKVTFCFQKNIIRKLSGITDIKPVIQKLGRPFIFKTNNRGGNYIVDRLFLCIDKGNFYEFKFSKYLAYDFRHKSNKGYAKRRSFYSKKRRTIYETLFLELLFTKTAVFKDKKALSKFEIKAKTLLENINLYSLMHENKKRAVALLNDFFRASFEFWVFIGNPPVFEVKTFDRDDRSKIILTINPNFDWTNCDWNKWNTNKI